MLTAPSWAIAAEREPPVLVSLSATADLVGTVGEDVRRGRVLSLLNGTLDFDLGALTRWRGATARLRVQASSGQEPNLDAGTLRGINNIEVPRQRTRLFEAFVEQALPSDRGSIRLGMYDLNSEFYTTEASGLLLGSPYGIGSELAATGSAGPSVYPSTALAVRVRLENAGGLYWQGAVLNAASASIGDDGGVETDFAEGYLGITQAGWKSDAGALSLGVWAYSEKQDDLERLDINLMPAQERSAGFYVLAERPVGPTTYFFRGGISEGRTTAFKASWQAGALRTPALSSRPDSQLSIGLGQELLSSPYRNLSAAGGQPLSASETALELTYADQVLPGVSLQPGLQLIHHPGGMQDRGTIGVLSLRLKVER